MRTKLKASQSSGVESSGRKNETVLLRMTKEEKILLSDIAKDYGSSQSEVMRTALHVVSGILKSEKKRGGEGMVKFTGVKHHRSK